MKKCQKTSKKVKKMKKAVQLQGRHVAFRGRPGKLSGPALVFSDSRLSELVVQSPLGLKVDLKSAQVADLSAKSGAFLTRMQ